MNNMKTFFAAVLAIGPLAGTANAADYIIDTKGAHASINFRVKHLGFSWLTGRFDTFSGTFSFDPKNPAASKISLEIDTASVNSNHAKRDKHIRNADFLEVDKYPKATFVSTSRKVTGERTGIVKGNLTLRGITKGNHHSGPRSGPGLSDHCCAVAAGLESGSNGRGRSACYGHHSQPPGSCQCRWLCWL